MIGGEGVAAKRVGGGEHEKLNPGPAGRQFARDDEAVARVVAAAGDDGDGGGRESVPHLAGDGAARPLHQLRAGDAALVDRHGVDPAHLVAGDDLHRGASEARRAASMRI